MNNLVWILQWIMAVIFASSGLLIIILPKEKLVSRLSWVRNYSDGTRLFICVSKIVGAIGLIVPRYFNILPVLTPIAAIGLAIIMVLAMLYHIKKNELKDIPATILFFSMAVFIAILRL
jgi:uncharacterized membrane protein YphA (DoxX/SURF4 family)